MANRFVFCMGLCTFASMKKVFILFLLLSAATVSQAQMYSYSANFELSEHNFCDTIPIVIENHLIYVEVETEGTRRRYLIDTGSGQGMVYDGTDASRYHELGNVVSHDANNKKDTVRVVQLPPFRMGRLLFSGYVASVLPRPQTRQRFDAVIGFDLFNRGLYAKIDTRARQLILTDRKGVFDEEQGYDVKYKLKWWVPYLYVSPFTRHVDQVLFDTGERAIYTMNKQSFDIHAYKSKNVGSQIEERIEGQQSIGTLSTEQSGELVFLRLDRLKWGDFSFLDVHAITTQGASRIGAQILDYGSIIIDPKRKRLKFQPYNTSDNVVVGNKPLSIAYVPYENRAAVGFIRSEHQAFKAGMRQGDIILRINGEEIPTFEAFQRYPFIEGRTYTFVLRDQRGFNKEVKIEK